MCNIVLIIVFFSIKKNNLLTYIRYINYLKTFRLVSAVEINQKELIKIIFYNLMSNLIPYSCLTSINLKSHITNGKQFSFSTYTLNMEQHFKWHNFLFLILISRIFHYFKIQDIILDNCQALNINIYLKKKKIKVNDIWNVYKILFKYDFVFDNYMHTKYVCLKIIIG